MAKLQIPKAACVLGLDHLFLSVDLGAAQLQGQSDRYMESLMENNYVAVPITCSTSGKL